MSNQKARDVRLRNYRGVDEDLIFVNNVVRFAFTQRCRVASGAHPMETRIYESHARVRFRAADGDYHTAIVHFERQENTVFDCEEDSIKPIARVLVVVLKKLVDGQDRVVALGSEKWFDDHPKLGQPYKVFREVVFSARTELCPFGALPGFYVSMDEPRWYGAAIAEVVKSHFGYLQKPNTACYFGQFRMQLRDLMLRTPIYRKIGTKYEARFSLRPYFADDLRSSRRDREVPNNGFSGNLGYAKIVPNGFEGITIRFDENHSLREVEIRFSNISGTDNAVYRFDWQTAEWEKV